MNRHLSKQYQVLLEQMTPLYTVVRVTATDEEDAQDKALAAVEDFQHDRLPDDGIWSIIPPVDIFSPTDDGEPTVLEISAVDPDASDQPSSSSTVLPDEVSFCLDDATMQFDSHWRR